MNKQMTLTEIDARIPHLKPKWHIPIPFEPYKVIGQKILGSSAYARNTKMTGPPIVCVSGGCDSSAVLGLAINAFGPNRVIAILMPYGTELGATSLRLGRLVCEKMGLPEKNILVRDIKTVVDDFASLNGWTMDRPDKKTAQILKGNDMARARMTIAFHIARKIDGRVVGSPDETEIQLGYSTPFGDPACHVSLVSNISKVNIWRLCVALGVPQEIINRPATPDLWEEQTAEGELGLGSYQTICQVLYGFYTLGMTEPEIAETGIPLQIVQAVLQRTRDYAFKSHLPVVL